MDGPLATAEELSAESVDPFPEFQLWLHRIPFLSPERSALIVERLRRYAVRSDNGKCIEWGGARKSPEYGNYGKLNFRMSGGRHCQEYVHRLSWFLKTGREIPEGYEVSHGCDNPPCFNPECIESELRRVNRQRSGWNTQRKRRQRMAVEEEAAA
jgi:hypothetical protein